MAMLDLTPWNGAPLHKDNPFTWWLHGANRSPKTVTIYTDATQYQPRVPE
jgi:hypothetical protein